MSASFSRASKKAFPKRKEKTMKNKKMVLVAVAGVSLALGVAALGAVTSGTLTLPTEAVDHEASHTLVEKAFQAPKVGEEGYRPYWRCNECCAADVSSARYGFESKEKVSLEDVVIPALVGAETSEIADGDLIANVGVEKFKYVDQGVNGVDGKEGTSTPLFVKDSGKTAIYFSASGKTGEATNPVDNTGCAEFRFSVPSESKASKSVTFSYCYQNWGKGGWAGSSSPSEPEGWTALCQFKDGAYYGLDLSSKLENDGQWHTVTLNYADSSATSEASSNLTDFIFKFADLRGYIMISGLSFETVKEVTLNNVNSDGSDKTEIVSLGSLPTTPTMTGKIFLGWYDESGNKVDAVTSSTGTLTAKWGVPSEESTYTVSSVAKTLNTDSVACADATAIIEKDDGVELQLQKDGVTSFTITLPAFDYNAAGRVDFILENNYGADPWGGIKAGNGNFLYSYIKAAQAHAYVIADGTNAYFYIEGMLLTSYGSDVASGTSGLSFTFERQSFNTYQSLIITDFKQYALDYMGWLSASVNALPDEVNEDNKDAAVTAYKEYANALAEAEANMTAYEKANYSAPSKIATVKTALAEETTEVLSIPSSGGSWYEANALGVYSDANFGVSFNAANDEVFSNYVSIGLQDGGYTGDHTYYIDFPKINYAAYSKVSFFLASPSSWQGFALKVDGKDWAGGLYWGDRETWGVEVTISTSGDSTQIDTDYTDPLTLSEDVAKGKKALRLERTRNGATGGYDSFAFTSLTATI